MIPPAFLLDKWHTFDTLINTMATTKTRINVSLSDDIERSLILLAKRDQVPHATKAAELIRQAIEINEDQVFDTIASARDVRNTKFVSHKMAWK
jgi:hypothetical protein